MVQIPISASLADYSDNDIYSIAYVKVNKTSL